MRKDVEGIQEEHQEGKVRGSVKCGGFLCRNDGLLLLGCRLRLGGSLGLLGRRSADDLMGGDKRQAWRGVECEMSLAAKCDNRAEYVLGRRQNRQIKQQ